MIGFQGIHGAYSEAAIISHLGNVKTKGYETFREVFGAVLDGEVDKALVPVENTIAGSVVRNYDLLYEHDVHIIGEAQLKIEHCLLGHGTLAQVKEVFSHPHALNQCRAFLEKHSMKAKPEYDTAGAAKEVANHGDRQKAAIASRLCADMYGLHILQEHIATNKENITRFFLISKDKEEKCAEKTSIAFKTKHYPGALVNCLQRLSKNDLNLTRLESRPILGRPWEYVFYADFEGGIDQENVKQALAEMDATALSVKILGSYKKLKTKELKT